MTKMAGLIVNRQAGICIGANELASHRSFNAVILACVRPYLVKKPAKMSLLTSKDFKQSSRDRPKPMGIIAVFEEAAPA